MSDNMSDEQKAAMDKIVAELQASVERARKLEVERAEMLKEIDELRLCVKRATRWATIEPLIGETQLQKLVREIANITYKGGPEEFYPRIEYVVLKPGDPPKRIIAFVTSCSTQMRRVTNLSGIRGLMTPVRDS